MLTFKGYARAFSQVQPHIVGHMQAINTITFFYVRFNNLNFKT